MPFWNVAFFKQRTSGHSEHTGLLIFTWKVTGAKIIAFLKLLQMSITIK